MDSTQIKKRKPNFSDTEILNFLKILEGRRTLINGESNLFGEALASAWNEVAEEYSATALIPRNGEELRNKFTDLKSRTKKRLGQIKNQQKQTGGTPTQHIKPYEELIIQLACRNSMSGFSSYVDAFSDISIVKVEPATTEDEEINVMSDEPPPTSSRVSPTPQRTGPKRKRRDFDDFDREMLEIAKRNVVVQEQRLKETKITNILLRSIAEKLGCQ